MNFLVPMLLAVFPAPLALAAPVASEAAPTPLPPAAATLAAGNNAFACDLYAQLRTADGNLFLSPYSVSSALAMTFAGARGETAAQMEQALRFPLPPTELHPAFAALAGQLEAVLNAGHVTLRIANSLWPHADAGLRDDYLALAKKNYGVAITPVDYARQEPEARGQINRWVEEKTQARIRNLIASPLSPLTRLVLVNAVYFQGNWETPFPTNRTMTAPFYTLAGGTAQTPLMNHTFTCGYGEWDALQAVELPYVGREVSMLVLLPKAKTAAALAELDASLTADHLRAWRGELARREVRVFLPKFTITWGTASLLKPLQALGIRDAFAATADFSGMNGRKGDLLVSDVLHQAFVDVNETGTEAAAATAVGMRMTAMPRQPPVFRADHAFLFLIQENATGSILFLGRLCAPAQAR